MHSSLKQYIRLFGSIFFLAALFCAAPALANVGKGTDAYEVQVDGEGNVTGYINGTSISATVTPGEWAEVQMVYDGATQKIYINGVLQDSQSLSGSIATNNNNLYLGSAATDLELDEVTIYDYARDQRQIAFDYGAGAPMGFWKFEEGTASTTKDTTPRGNHGTLYGNTSWTTSGRFGSALTFDGDGDYVNINATMAMAVTDSLTLSAWLKTASSTSNTLNVATVARKIQNTYTKRLGSTNTEYGEDIAIDGSDNIYLLGSVNGNTDLDGDAVVGEGGVSGESATGYGGFDIVLTSFDTSGTYRWSKRLGSTGSDEGYGLAVDGNDNVYLTGYTTGTADLDGDGTLGEGGVNGESATGYAGKDIIIASFDSTGTYRLSERLGGTDDSIYADMGHGIDVDSSNNVYVGAAVSGDVDLDGDGTLGEAGVDGEQGTGYALSDNVIVSFDSAGTYRWSKRMGGIRNDNNINGDIAVDGSGNVYLVASIWDDVDLDGDGIIGEAGVSGEIATTTEDFKDHDIAIASFSSTGTYRWSYRLGGPWFDVGEGVAVDGNNNVYLVAIAGSVIDLDGDGTIGEPGVDGEPLGGGFANFDIVITSFDSTGTYRWSDRLSGEDANDDRPKDIAVDGNNNVYIVGNIEGDADLNGNGVPGEANINGEDGTGYGTGWALDIAIASFDSAGTYRWSERLGGSAGWDRGYGAAADSSNNVYVTGYVTGDVDLDGDGVFGELDVAGEDGTGYADSSDMFIAGFGSDGSVRVLSEYYSDYQALQIVNNRATAAMTASTTARLAATSTRAVNDDAWHFVSGVYGDGTVKLYVDGRLEDTQTFSVGAASLDSVLVGADSNLASYFEGTIDEVKVFDYARTAYEIRADYNGVGGSGRGAVLRLASKRGRNATWDDGGFGGDPAVAQWRFEEGSGTTASDTSGNGHNGTITGASWSRLGKVGNALSFDGAGDYVAVEASVSNTAALTLSTWLKTNNSSGSILDMVTASEQELQAFTKRLGGTSADIGYAITVDANNNVYLAGYASGNADLNGNGTLGEAGVSGEDATGYGSIDIVISSFDSSGTYRWSERLGGASNDYGYAITVDANNNVYLSGYASGNADLNGNGTLGEAGVSGEDATGYGQTDIIISSFDNAGSYRWSQRLGSVNFDYGQALAVDANNNVYLAGRASGNADLNGNGTLGEAGVSGEDATGYGSSDIIISSFDSSGTYRWSERLGGTSVDEGYALAVDANNNVYLAGRVTDNTDLNGNGTLGEADVSGEDATGYGGTDIITVRFSDDGFILPAVHRYHALQLQNGNALFERYSTTSAQTIGGSSALADNTWHFVASTYDSGTMKLYVDGVLENSTSYTNAMNSVDVVKIGTNATTSRYFDGLIDEVSLYNYARTPAQIAWAYNGGKPVAHWKFDDGGGQTALDASGNGYTGYITVGASQSVLWSNGVYNSALGFDGTDDYVSASINASDFTGDFSMGGWVKTSEQGGIMGFTAGLPVDGTHDKELYIFTNNRVHFRTFPQGTLLSNSSVTDGRWHHVMATYNTTDGGRIYIDGKLDVLDSSGEGWSGSTASYGGYMTLGIVSQEQNYFNGLLDDLRFYNYTRSPEQITQDYNGGAAVAFGSRGGSGYGAVSAVDDTLPNSFSFVDQAVETASAQIESNIVHITGINLATSISIDNTDGGEYRICSNASCSTVAHAYGAGTGTIDPGEYVQLRITSGGSQGVIVRATSTVGTVSEVWSVTTDACGGATTVQDADGNTYNIAAFGSQCWMMENLNVGTRIAGSSEQTDNATIEKYCYSDSDANCTTDGGLYQWDEAMQYASTCNGTGAPPNDACASPVQGICPAGWHIPSHYEITTLEREVCASGTCASDFPYDTTTTGYRGTDEGSRLANNVTGLNWTSDALTGDADFGTSGFDLPAAGYRGTAGGFGNRTLSTDTWSSTEVSSTNAWNRNIYYTLALISRDSLDKLSGFTVRCVKD